MKRVVMAMFGLSVVVALGTCLLAPQAHAVSSKQIGFPASACAPPNCPLNSGASRVSFFLGEDGSIWYTSTRPTGNSPTVSIAPPYAPTGNSKNPFDSGGAFGAPAGCLGDSTTCNGFVSGPDLALVCAGTGDTCSGIYARTPGPGTFIDSPTVQQSLGATFGSAGGSAIVAATGQTSIFATGLDNRFWYTIFDSANIAGTTGMCGPGPVPGCPGKDPFFAAAEDKNTTGPGPNGDGSGFVNQTLLAGQCAALSRTCSGIWVRFP